MHLQSLLQHLVGEVSCIHRIYYHYQGQRAPQGSCDSIGLAFFVSRKELGEGVSVKLSILP